MSKYRINNPEGIVLNDNIDIDAAGTTLTVPSGLTLAGEFGIDVTQALQSGGVAPVNVDTTVSEVSGGDSVIGTRFTLDYNGATVKNHYRTIWAIASDTDTAQASFGSYAVYGDGYNVTDKGVGLYGRSGNGSTTNYAIWGDLIGTPGSSRNYVINASSNMSGTGTGPQIGVYAQTATSSATNTGTLTGVSAWALKSGAAIGSGTVIGGEFRASNGATNIALRTQEGDVVFNELGGNSDFRVEGDTDQNMLFIDASLDTFGIGTGSPTSKLHLIGSGFTDVIRLETTSNVGASGHGLYLTNNGTLTSGGTRMGIRTELSNTFTNGFNHAIYGRVLGSVGGNQANGIYGLVQSTATTNTGVNGNASGAGTTNYGVQANANNATTNYGISANATGAATTNYGGYFSATGGTSNFSLYAVGGATTGDVALNVYADAIQAISVTKTASDADLVLRNGQGRIEVSSDNIAITSDDGGFAEAWSDMAATYNAIGFGSNNYLEFTAGLATFNPNGGDNDLRVEGDTDTNLLYVNAGTDRVGIGTANPSYKLYVQSTDSTLGYNIYSNMNGASTASITAAIYGNNTRTGTTFANYGIFGSATGNTTAGGRNFGLVGSVGTSLSVHNGDTGVFGFVGNQSSSTTSHAIYAKNNATAAASATRYGIYSKVEGAETGNTFGLYASNTANSSGVNTGYAINASATGNNATNYALFLNSTGATTNYGIFSSNGIWVQRNGNVTFNDLGGDFDFRIEGDTDINLFFVDASADAIGIGKNNPAELLDVAGNAKFDGQAAGGYNSITPSAPLTETVDWDNGNFQTVDFGSKSSGGAVVFTLNNPIAGAAYTLKIIQGANLNTTTWPAAVKWEGGTAYTPTATDNAEDIITFVYDGTSYYGSFGKNFS